MFESDSGVPRMVMEHAVNVSSKDIVGSTPTPGAKVNAVSVGSTKYSQLMRVTDEST